jgi:hypothetical protein
MEQTLGFKQSPNYKKIRHISKKPVIDCLLFLRCHEVAKITPWPDEQNRLT